LAKRRTKKQTQKQTQGRPQFWGFPWFLWLAIGLGIVAVAVFAFTRTLTASGPVSPNHSDELKAAIVDQLYNVRSNQAFIERTTQQLEDYGFEIDVYQGDDVTVDLYQKLPSYGYRLIIFRVHSGVLIGSEAVANKTWLFTNEPFSRMRYYFSQMRGQVTHGTINESIAPVFTVGAKFVTQAMKEQFAGTAIIVMGCAGYGSDDLAQAFIEKGASTYMAWDASVGLSYVDDATTALIEKLFIKELPIAEAVSEVMEEEGTYPSSGAVLKYHPLTSGDKTLRQLIE
jgi:hypothetical protein